MWIFNIGSQFGSQKLENIILTAIYRLPPSPF
uniref:Uncharacterized protein n=1 Tax=Siphoviridae sp. ctWsj12 TaxID=2826363 RepID=A0A8S5NR13_9CAUD|nr:MAG TPA: hypothetical protein [Siphoviridae sp. ctWsj12]